MTDSLLPSVIVEPEAPAEASILWLHGLGADGHDFEPVARMLQPALPVPVRFVLPHAPRIPVTINGGMEMRAWYDMHNLDHPRHVDWESVRTSEAAISRLLKREREQGIPDERLFLAGFSQGGALAVRLGLQRQEPLAGLIVLSSYLLQDGGEAFPVDKKNKIPVFMGHGTEDPIIPYALAEASRNTLRSHGCELQWQDYPMPHSVCQEEIEDLARWLTEQLQAEN